MNTEITQAADLLSLMPNTQKQIADFAEQIKWQIINGETDVKKLLFQKKYIEKTLEAIFDDPEVKEIAVAEIEKYGKDGAGYEDLKFEVQSRKSWDYSMTRDSRHAELKAKETEVKEQIKQREKFLQNIPERGIADPETGELIYGAAFTTATFIKSSFQKAENENWQAN